MPWSIETLKIVGNGEIIKSNLYNYELHLGYYEDFIVIDDSFREVIKIVMFPKYLFEQKFYGEDPSVYTMHFIKFREGMPEWLETDDYKLIAKKYKEQTGKKLKVVKEI